MYLLLFPFLKIATAYLNDRLFRLDHHFFFHDHHWFGFLRSAEFRERLRQTHVLLYLRFLVCLDDLRCAIHVLELRFCRRSHIRRARRYHDGGGLGLDHRVLRVGIECLEAAPLAPTLSFFLDRLLLEEGVLLHWYFDLGGLWPGCSEQ